MWYVFVEIALVRNILGSLLVLTVFDFIVNGSVALMDSIFVLSYE